MRGQQQKAETNIQKETALAHKKKERDINSSTKQTKTKQRDKCRH